MPNRTKLRQTKFSAPGQSFGSVVRQKPFSVELEDLIANGKTTMKTIVLLLFV